MRILQPGEKPSHHDWNQLVRLVQSSAQTGASGSDFVRSVTGTAVASASEASTPVVVMEILEEQNLLRCREPYLYNGQWRVGETPDVFAGPWPGYTVQDFSSRIQEANAVVGFPAEELVDEFVRPTVDAEIQWVFATQPDPDDGGRVLYKRARQSTVDGTWGVSASALELSATIAPNYTIEHYQTFFIGSAPDLSNARACLLVVGTILPDPRWLIV